jgi:hypothetical protein
MLKVRFCSATMRRQYADPETMPIDAYQFFYTCTGCGG